MDLRLMDLLLMDSRPADSSRQAFDRLLADLRPKLHRYCARMTGSVIDGEDVVQEALLKAVAASGAHKPVGDLERWLFRIAHNAAIDHLRRRARAEAARSSEAPEMLVDPESPVDDPLIVEAGL